MSEHTHHNPNAGPGFETTDVHVGPIYRFIAALVGLMVAGIVAAWIIFQLLDFRANMEYSDMNKGAIERSRQVPSGPLLQVTNHDDLLQFRQQEAKDVEGHATWLDKNARVVRLPVDRALELVSERGLPVFKGESSSKEPAAAK